MIHYNQKTANILLLFFFVLLIVFSIFICYRNLLVERKYSVFSSEEEVEAASVGLTDIIRQIISYGSAD